MPVAAIGALAAGGLAIAEAGSIAAVSFSILGLSGWSAILARVAVSFVISELGSALSPKAKAPSTTGLSAQSQQRTQQITQAVGPSEIVYGEVLKSGTVVYASNTASNAYTHIVIVLADHEVEGIDEVWVNSDVIPNDYLDSNGNVVTGKYAGYLRIKKHLGDDGQTADSDLIAEDTAWTSDHRLRGRSYIYCRYKRNQSVFPQSPNFAAIVRGKKAFDSRAGMAIWSPNIALMAYDWLTDTKFGVGASDGKLGTDETESAANSCEEMVAAQPIVMTVSSVATSTDILTLTDANANKLLQFQRGDAVQVTSTGSIPSGLSGSTDYYVIPYQFSGTPRIKLAASLSDAISGVAIDITSAGSGAITLTKTHEPRYFGGGVITADKAVGDALNDILSGMCGRLTYTGGQFRMFAGVWRGPSVTIDEDDLVDVISEQTKVSRSSRFNTVIGTFVGPTNNWQAADYPQVQSADAVANDMGEILQTQIDLPFTQRASMAQRIAAIRLSLGRNESVITWPGKLTCLQLQPLDTVYVNNTRFGLSSAVYEVQTWKLGFKANQDGVPMPSCTMTLQSATSSAYDWDYSNEVLVDPAPNTNLPDPFFVPEIVGLGVNSIAISTRGGDTTYRAVASWTAITEGFVNPGGYVHFRYALTGTDNWNYLQPVDGSQTQADLFSGELGQGYDIQVWLENSLGLIGLTYTLSNFTLGSIGGVGATLDWGNWVDSVGSTNDYGNWTDSVGTTNDWGGWA